MKVKTASVVNLFDLEREIENRYGKTVDVANELFPEGIMNGCYKDYFFNRDNNPSEERVMIDSVIASLNINGPILINISWQGLKM